MSRGTRIDSLPLSTVISTVSLHGKHFSREFRHPRFIVFYILKLSHACHINFIKVVQRKLRKISIGDISHSGLTYGVSVSI